MKIPGWLPTNYRLFPNSRVCVWHTDLLINWNTLSWILSSTFGNEAHSLLCSSLTGSAWTYAIQLLRLKEVRSMRCLEAHLSLAILSASHVPLVEAATPPVSHYTSDDRETGSHDNNVNQVTVYPKGRGLFWSASRKAYRLSPSRVGSLLASAREGRFLLSCARWLALRFLLKYYNALISACNKLWLTRKNLESFYIITWILIEHLYKINIDKLNIWIFKFNVLFCKYMFK